MGALADPIKQRKSLTYLKLGKTNSDRKVKLARNR
jgi:hypothetical protein